MAEITFENVAKSLGGAPVVKGLSLAVKDGEFFTFVGPSGSGKSTVLNLLAGLIEPDGGRICFDGADVGGLSPRERDVAMVFQSYALYPHMTVYENIAFPLRVKKTTGGTVDAEVRRVADLLGIAGFLGRKPRELSGGQRQRVALARAIVRRPSVFLLDEPLSNLDAKLRVQMRAELRKLQEELRITTVYVTHDQEEAMGLSDSVAVLHGGEVQQHGAPEEVYKRPSNIFVAGFIGSPQMNFLKAGVLQEEPLIAEAGGLRIETGLMGAHVKEPVIGIRPEDVAVSASSGAFEATAVINEFSGRGYWVDLEWDGRRLKGFARQEERIKEGGRAFFDIPPGRCHLFDRATGKRL